MAGVLHRLTGVPWVAEFRDPWVGNVLAEPLPSFHRRLRRRLEHWIVSNAARVVFLSSETEATYLRRYPELAGRSVVVPNGYDAADLGPPPTRRPAASPFRLVYTGTLDRPAEAAAFMTGLAELVGRRPEVAQGLTIDFIGHTSPEVADLVARYLEAPGLRAMIRFLPFMPRAQALQYVREADACLVMLGEEPGMSQFVPASSSTTSVLMLRSWRWYLVARSAPCWSSSIGAWSPTRHRRAQRMDWSFCSRGHTDWAGPTATACTSDEGLRSSWVRSSMRPRPLPAEATVAGASPPRPRRQTNRSGRPSC